MRAKEAIMELNRRAFVKGSAGVAVAVAAAGCASVATAGAEEGAATPEPTSTIDTEVLVCGAGGAGMFAAYEAGKAGAKVLVVSNSPDAEATNGGMVSGTAAVETPYLDEIGQKYTSQQLFEIMYDFSHYTVNANLLRNCVNALPGNVQVFNDMGVDFTLGGDRAGVGFLEVHLFATPGKNTLFQTTLENDYGVEFMYSTEVFAPVMGDDGAVVGVLATDADGACIQINAKAVVLACGGFLCDEEQTLKEFGTGIVQFSTPYQTGKGIALAEAAGAYRESQVGLGMTDIVAASELVGFTFTNPLLMAGLFGNLLVDQRGKRFTNEFEVANESMGVGGEGLMRTKRYYAIYSQATIDDLKTMGYYQHIGEPECWPTGSMLYTSPMENIDELIAEGIDVGWVFKADTVAELAEAAGLPELEDSVKAYDELVAAGADTQFGKQAEMMEAVEVGGPYYLLQFNPGAFNTFGGCRTDEDCRAQTVDFETIPGLYIAGVENGSLYSRPYYFIGGTCSGLAYSSGRIAGENAAAYAATLA